MAYLSEREYVERLDQAETQQQFIEAVFAITEAVRHADSPLYGSWVWALTMIGNNTFRFMPEGTELPSWFPWDGAS